MGLCLSKPSAEGTAVGDAQPDAAHVVNPLGDGAAASATAVSAPMVAEQPLQLLLQQAEAEPEQGLELTDRVTGASEAPICNMLPLDEREQQVNDQVADGEADAVKMVVEVPTEDVRKVFEAFASFGSHQEKQTEMDSTKFMKLARECNLIDSNLTTVDIDVFFLKAKPREKRRITFEQFLTSMSACAEKKGVTLPVLLRMVVEKGSPEANGTRPDNVRLYDDKSTYTGLARMGGPTTVDESHDLATMLDRSDQRTSRRLASAGGAPLPGTQSTFSKSVVMGVRRKTINAGDTTAVGSVLDLHGMFESFATFGGGSTLASKAAAAPVRDMDNTRFVKLCKDCGLFDDQFTSTWADIIFRKQAKTKGHVKISFLEFKTCLEQIAVAKGIEVSELHKAITSCGGPMINTAV